MQYHVAAAAAKSLQSCPTLCDPRDGSPTGSPVPGILQARELEWGAIIMLLDHYKQNSEFTSYHYDPTLLPVCKRSIIQGWLLVVIPFWKPYPFEGCLTHILNFFLNTQILRGTNLTLSTPNQKQSLFFFQGPSKYEDFLATDVMCVCSQGNIKY